MNMKCACLRLPLPLHGSIQLISIACPPTNHECCWQPLERTGPPCVRKWVSLAGLRDLMLLMTLCDAECKESQALHGTRMVLSCHLHKLFTMQVKAIKLLFNRTSNDYDSILSGLPSFKIAPAPSKQFLPTDSAAGWSDHLIPVFLSLKHCGMVAKFH